MSARRRLLAALLVAAGALLFLELGARVFVLPNRKLVWRPLPPFTGLETEEQRAWLARHEGTGVDSTGYGLFDPVLGWTHARSTVSPDGAVHIDARGRRSARTYPEPSPPGTRHVLACGDSFTFCAEVGDAEAWPAQLEALLPDCEVWNFGVGGYGTDQALLRVTREAEGPVDALVVGLLLENIG